MVLNVQAAARQFIEETRTNGTFEHSGAKSSMYVQGALDHRVARFVRTHERPNLCVLCVHCGGEALKQMLDLT